MINTFTKKLFEDINEAVSGAANAGLSQPQLKQMLEGALRKAQLVTREEFDAQQAVLLRTREKVEQLERQVSALEARLKGEEPQANLDAESRANWEM